jgi:hypothetical protein
MGVFWWWNHQNTPISSPNPGNSQRALNIWHGWYNCAESELSIMYAACQSAGEGRRIDFPYNPPPVSKPIDLWNKGS